MDRWMGGWMLVACFMNVYFDFVFMGGWMLLLDVVFI